MKSIFDFNIDELQEFIRNGGQGEVSLSGIEDRKDFDKLFKHRATPTYIAEALLKEKVASRPKQVNPQPKGGCQTPDSAENKANRLQLKQMELELKRQRVESVTQVQSHIYKRLQALEDGQAVIIASLANLTGKLNELLARD